MRALQIGRLSGFAQDQCGVQPSGPQRTEEFRRVTLLQVKVQRVPGIVICFRGPQQARRVARYQVMAQRDLQARGRRLDLAGDALPGPLERLTDRARVRQQLAPGRRELDAGSRPAVQRLAAFLLQQAQLSAYRRLAERQDARGGRDAALPGDDAERVQVFGVHRTPLSRASRARGG